MPKYKVGNILKARDNTLWILQRVSCWRPCRQCDFRKRCRSANDGVFENFHDFCSDLLGLHVKERKESYVVFKKLKGGI